MGIKNFISGKNNPISLIRVNRTLCILWGFSFFIVNAQTEIDTSYFPDGSIKSIGFLKNKEKDSSWIFYHSNGAVKMEGIYLSGKKNGVWDYYLPNGVMSHRLWYRNDSLHKKENFLHKNGSFEKRNPPKNIKNRR